MILAKIKMKWPKVWFKETKPTHTVRFPQWNTDVYNPEMLKNTFGGSARIAKANGKVGVVYTVKNRKFGERKFKFRKNGAKPLTTFRDGYAFGNALEKKGFLRLGGGAYSTVYGHPSSNRVIKVTESADNWIDYVRWAAHKGYAGTHAPAVYSYKKFNRSRSPFSVAVMERMDKVFQDVDDVHDFRMLSGLMHYGGKGNQKAKEMLDMLVPGVSQFVTDLYEEFGNEDRFDLHDGNFMVRADGTFALTDPVCGKSKLTATRLRAGDFTPALIYFRITDELRRKYKTSSRRENTRYYKWSGNNYSFI